MLKSQALAFVLVLSAGLFAATAVASETPKDPQYLSLYNYGNYALGSVTVNWKSDGKTLHKRFTKNVLQTQAFCADLSTLKSDSGESIPLGAEVWLTANIQAGGSSSCRKDTKHYYQASGNTWSTYMQGAIANNNNCKNTTDTVMPGDVVSGNSEGC